MNFGAHIYVFTERWSDASLPVLDRARALGLDCLEIAVGDDVRFTPALTRRSAEALGLTLIVSPGGEWPLDCDLSSADPANRQAGLAWHKRQVELAEALGATAYTGALYGHPGVVHKRRPDAAEFQRAAEGLHELADHAESRGVTLVLEPMSHFRTHLVNTPGQLMRLIGMAEHANVFGLLDTYHLITEVTDYAGAIRAAAPRLWGVHACENNRGVPGSGLVPWGAVFATLGEIGYDGRIILESYNSAIGDFACERGLFHNVCPDGEAFVIEGLRFLRRGLEKITA